MTELIPVEPTKYGISAPIMSDACADAFALIRSQFFATPTIVETTRKRGLVCEHIEAGKPLTLAVLSTCVGTGGARAILTLKEAGYIEIMPGQATTFRVTDAAAYAYRDWFRRRGWWNGDRDRIEARRPLTEEERGDPGLFTSCAPTEVVNAR